MRELSDDITIWRYMRLPAFLEMLMQFGLFQTRVTEFDDALEGAYGYNDVTLHDRLIAALDDPEAPRNITFHLYRRNPQPSDPIITAHPLSREDVIREARWHTCVTCWYEHDSSESYAMWRVYGIDSFAVAIQTTVGALRAALSSAGDVKIGGVEYTKLPTIVETVHELFFHKRPEFSSECEVRSVQVFPARITGQVQIESLRAPQMDALLKTLIVAPGMRDTMFSTLQTIVGAVLHNQGIQFDASRLRRSSLDDERLP